MELTKDTLIEGVVYKKGTEYEIITESRDIKESIDFQAFTKELAKLSLKYGVAIQSIGGVEIGELSSIVYSNDPTSGDLEYRANWK